MKLSTRLFGATALLTTASSAVVGLVGLNVSYNSEIARIDKALSSVVSSVKDAGSDKLLAAIESANSSGTQISVGLMDSQLQVTVLAGDDKLLPSAPASQPLVQARSKAVTVDAATHFRFRSVALSRTDYLLIASDVKAIQESRAASTTGLLAFTGSVALLSIVLIWLLIRRDLKVLQKLAQAAKEISKGNQDVQLPKFKAGNEVVLLSNSLGEMVETLESAITTERNAQRAIQEFVGDASHELRTPLTVIKGYTEMLQARGGDSEFRDKALERVSAEVIRMDQLIGDMLTMAELGEERHAERQVVNLTEMLEEAVGDFATLSKGRLVSSEIAAGVGINGAPDQLHQLLNNIFSNIQRHTPADAQVKVSLTTTEANVLLVVDDAGPGLPEDAYARGIDGFARFDPFAARANGGTGLGMTIMRKIVADHGGKVALSKSPLGGLRTEIMLAR